MVRSSAAPAAALGVLNATEHNAPTRTYLEHTGGGIERVAFTTPSSSM